MYQSPIIKSSPSSQVPRASIDPKTGALYAPEIYPQGDTPPERPKRDRARTPPRRPKRDRARTPPPSAINLGSLSDRDSEVFSDLGSPDPQLHDHEPVLDPFFEA